MKWKLAALALMAVAVVLILVAPLATVQVTIQLPADATTAAPQALNTNATLVAKIVVGAVALSMLGVLAWVARHLLRRRRSPDA